MSFWLLQWTKSLGDNFGCVDKDLSIYRGAYPSHSTWEKLKKTDVKVILSLCDGPIGDAHEEATEHGYTWIRVPMSDTDAPTESQVLTAVEYMRPGKVFVHCRGGRHRTTLIVAAFRVLVQNWPKKAAWKEGERYGWYDALGHKVLRLWFEREIANG